MNPTTRDLIGLKFGRWIVISKSKSVKRRTRWNCVCDCGVNKEVLGQSLISGTSTSCGCYNSEKHRKEGQSQAWHSYFERVIKQGATQRNIKFELSFDFVREICSLNCSYCGVSPREWKTNYNFYILDAKNKRTRNPDIEFAKTKIIFVNGIDRVDSGKYYSIDNVVPCCVVCNNAKSNMSLADFESWIFRVANHRNLI